MKVLCFSCENFRNIIKTELLAHPKMNILYGDNAQGKTNIIEAIWLFTGQKSFQGATDRQMILNSAEYSNLKLEFKDSSREQELKLRLEEKKRTISRNGVNLKTNSAMCGIFSAVTFSPVQLEIASGGPAVRRRFLDSAVSQINLKYADYLSQYEKVLEQRNALLKDIKKYPSLEGTLDIWDMQLSKLGTILTIYRNNYIDFLKTFANKLYNGFSDENFSIEYSSSVFENVNSIENYTDGNINIFYETLKKSREKDLILKYTTMGIHRDDLIFKINGFSVREFGSQGQKRSVVLALKLAEAGISKKITGETPVILFDDVLSELDESRQEYLLNNLDDFQVFITCCEPANTTRHKSGKVFQVKSGEIISQKTTEEG